MNSTRLALALCCTLSCAVCQAAGKEHPAESPAPATMLVADFLVPSLPGVGMPEAIVLPQPAVLLQPVSAVEAAMDASMPDVPFMTRPALIFDARAASGTVTRSMPATTSRWNMERLPDAPGVSKLNSMPLAGTARHLGAQHFNTDDGSSIDAFAICYRLNGRSSVQVIPGDPAPVKIPLNTMANNMGVTVGMVVRLSKNR